MKERKKIGILTLHYGLNYGGVLQAYALKEVLMNQGFEVQIIDRIPDGFGKIYPYKRALIHPITQRAFARFRRKCLKPISKPIFSSKELYELLEKNFDVCIVGSDQVWRRGGFSVDGDYFLINQKRLNIIKLSYAASFGNSEWNYTEKETNEIIAGLKEFKAISVREEDGVSLLQDNCRLSSQCVLDPTLLAPQDIYIPLLNESKVHCEGKLVSYILDWTERKRSMVAELGEVLRIPTHDILPIQKKKHSYIKQILCPSFSVYDWLKAIATAEYVVTDSFHGMVFSIIFNKPFTVIGNVERGLSRFKSILRNLDIEYVLIKEDDEIKLNVIDYGKVMMKLKTLREISEDFLMKNVDVDSYLIK